jgi:hypothetical protein
MRNRWYFVLLPLLVLVIFSAACSSASPVSATPVATTALDGATLVQQRCAVCHPLTFVERSRHTQAQWQLIVNVMISRGAQLSPSEEATVVSFLVANFGQ